MPVSVVSGVDWRGLSSHSHDRTVGPAGTKRGRNQALHGPGSLRGGASGRRCVAAQPVLVGGVDRGDRERVRGQD